MSHPTTRPRGAVLLALLTACALVVSCSKDQDPKAAALDRADVVAELVEQVILPANAEVASLAADASDAVLAMCNDPSDESLKAAREAVAKGWARWRSTDSYDLGPAMKRRSTSVVSYKVDTAKVDSTVLSTPPTDPETVRNRTSSSLRGYGAAWHLMTAAPATLQVQEARCAYLTAVMAVVADETAIVNEGWTTGLDGAPPYRDTAKGKGDGALTPTAVIDSVVNMQLSQLESTSKLLTAAAEADSGTPSDLPVGELFQLAAQTRGIAESYDELAPLLKPDVAESIRKEIAALEKQLSGAEVLPTEVPPDAATSKRVAAAVEELRTTIATEVVSALDVTISFSENDGDS